MTVRAARGDAHEGGFTVVELTLAIMILGVVLVALAGLFFGVATVNRESKDRLDASAGRQFAATYFADDVFGAASVATGANVTAPCATGTLPLVQFTRNSFSGTGASLVPVTTYVDYVLSGSQLQRNQCTVAGTVSDTKILARDVSGVVTTCLTATATFNPCTDPTGMRVYQLMVTQVDMGTATPSFTVSGARRVA